MADENEDDLLRSVALQNAQAVLHARQRAEQELIQAKGALEHGRRSVLRCTPERQQPGTSGTGGAGNVHHVPLLALGQRHRERLCPERQHVQEYPGGLRPGHQFLHRRQGMAERAGYAQGRHGGVG